MMRSERWERKPRCLLTSRTASVETKSSMPALLDVNIASGS
jgi:hypothetical protein